MRSVTIPTAAFLSFRFGPTDGVSVVARRWMEIFATLGFAVVTVAGDGDIDRVVEGLGIDDRTGDPDALDAALRSALSDVDLVVVENLATIPLNLDASRAVGRVLAGRPAILHHHDPPWHRERFTHITELPLHHPAWRHVTINHTTAAEMAARGIDSTVIYNGFERRGVGDRDATRRALGVAPDEKLLAHPVRAIERKNLPAAIAAAEATGATYWLLGPAEEGYDGEMSRLLADAGCRVVHRPWAVEADIYAAADAALYPSTWEGFGNPPLEAALYRRHCMVGGYPFAAELRGLGFEFIDVGDHAALRQVLARPDEGVLERNELLVDTHFSLERVAAALADLLDRAGWLP